MTEFKIGDRVFARVRSYPFWPAKVESLPTSTKKQYKVIFYFTLQTGAIDKKSIEPFNDETIQKFKPLCKTKNYFREALEDALIDEAQEGLEIRSDEIRELPLYEEPPSKKKKSVPRSSSLETSPVSVKSGNNTTPSAVTEVSSTQSRAAVVPATLQNSASSLNNHDAKTDIVMPLPEDLFALHLELVRSLYHKKPDHTYALSVMNRIQTFLEWPVLIKTVPELVENIYKISNYSRNKQVQLKAIHLYNKMKWTLFCNREIEFIEKQFPV